MALNFGSQNITDIIAVEGNEYEPQILPEATGGTDPVVYSLTPDLPQGITFDPTKRILSINPTVSFLSTEYTYLATDSVPETSELTFNLTVIAQVINDDNVNLDNALIQNEPESRPVYITIESETLAGIIFRYYGSANQDILKQVLEVNPKLSDQPLILPQGTNVILPEISEDQKIEPVALWV